MSMPAAVSAGSRMATEGVASIMRYGEGTGRLMIPGRRAVDCLPSRICTMGLELAPCSACSKGGCQ